MTEENKIIYKNDKYKFFYDKQGDFCVNNRVYLSLYGVDKDEMIITDLIKDIKRKEQECEELCNEIINTNSVIEDIALNLMEHPVTNEKLEEAKNTTIVDIAFKVKDIKKQLQQAKFL